MEKEIAFYVLAKTWSPKEPEEPKERDPWKSFGAWEKWRAALLVWQKIRERKVYWKPVYKGSWEEEHWYRWNARHGEYRIGSSYRRNPEHKPKERDENRELWRKSRKDWRHHNGWKRRCTCSGCIGWEVYNRGGDRARMRDALRNEIFWEELSCNETLEKPCGVQCIFW